MENQNINDTKSTKYEVDTNGPTGFTLSVSFMEKVEDAIDQADDGQNAFAKFEQSDLDELYVSLRLLFAEHRQARGLPLRMR